MNDNMERVIQDLSQIIDCEVYSEGTVTEASGYIEQKLTDEEADKALKNLEKREKKSKFRQINDIRKIRIGDKVRSRNGFPMVVTGIFQDGYEDFSRGTLYLDFKDNCGDVWEEDLCDVEWDGNWLSVLFKKIFR